MRAKMGPVDIERFGSGDQASPAEDEFNYSCHLFILPGYLYDEA
jgi:hypothetical protein